MEVIIVIGIIGLIGWGLLKLAAMGEEAERSIAERRQSAQKARVMAADSFWKSMVGGAKTYPVGIVGEASYQDTIGHLNEGELVSLWHEPGNPYDKRAIAVADGDGDTIGYIPRNFWLREVVLDEAKPVTARVMTLAKGPKATGVTIEVALVGVSIRQRAFKP